MRAGRLRHKLIVQSPSGSRDSVGERTTTWSNVDSAWGAVEPLNSREVIAASQAQMLVTHKILMRYQSTLASMTIGWRVLFGSRAFDIRGIRNIDEKDRTMELLCDEGLLYQYDTISVDAGVFSIDFSVDFA